MEESAKYFNSILKSKNLLSSSITYYQLLADYLLDIMEKHYGDEQNSLDKSNPAQINYWDILPESMLENICITSRYLTSDTINQSGKEESWKIFTLLYQVITLYSRSKILCSSHIYANIVDSLSFLLHSKSLTFYKFVHSQGENTEFIVGLVMLYNSNYLFTYFVA